MLCRFTKVIALSAGVAGISSISYASRPAWDVFAGLVEAGAGLGAIMAGQPVGVGGVIDGGMRAKSGFEDMMYGYLQEGKEYLKSRGRQDGWNKVQKMNANLAYKEVLRNFHRSGSPDVFPEAYK